MSEHTSRAGLVAAFLPGLLFAFFISRWPGVARGQAYSFSLSWMPSLDLTCSFHLDGLSLLFALIISGVGIFVTLYSAAYMAGNRHRLRFFIFLQAFLLSMLGVVLADNLLLLFIFWEGTTIFSYLLIGFDHESERARENARQGLLVTAGGGLALLLGILLLKIAGGTYVISDWPAADGAVRQHALYPLILGGILLGAMTKSAQFPFHFWLPNAMSAPTPISAFLHAATMVKAGIYLLMRCHPLLGGTTAWMAALVVIGGITAVWGAVQALGPRDLKRVLAYTTLMALGILTMFLGGQSVKALTAAVTFLLVHALYKAALFLAVGIIDHQTGSRSLNRLGGLFRRMPFTALAVAASTLSMAGFPLFFGFIGKEIMYEGALSEEVFPAFATTAALLANALMTAVAAIVLLTPFAGKTTDATRKSEEASWLMWLGPVVLGGLGIIFGLVPEWVSRVLIEPAVFAFHPAREEIRLAIWHGFSLSLLLSVLTLALGATVYMLRRQLCPFVKETLARLPLPLERIYALCLKGFVRGAEVVTARLQNGSLHFYLAVILSTVILAVSLPWLANVGSLSVMPPAADNITAAALMVFIGVAALVVVTADRRLAAIGGLSGVGAGVALLFLLLGAPDIALTQLLVETLTIILVSIVLLRLPPMSQAGRRSRRRRGGDAALSIAFGVLVASMLAAIMQTPLDRSLSEFFENNSYLAAHGRNIVNVILVDFRSLDTLGEITVVVLAAWAAVTLLRKPEES